MKKYAAIKPNSLLENTKSLSRTEIRDAANLSEILLLQRMMTCRTFALQYCQTKCKQMDVVISILFLDLELVSWLFHSPLNFNIHRITEFNSTRGKSRF